MKVSKSRERIPREPLSRSYFQRTVVHESSANDSTPRNKINPDLDLVRWLMVVAQLLRQPWPTWRSSSGESLRSLSHQITL